LQIILQSAVKVNVDAFSTFNDKIELDSYIRDLAKAKAAVPKY